MSLREKLERMGGYRDDDAGEDGGGGKADDATTMQPGPGETQESIDDLHGKKVDKGDDVKDDAAKAKADADAKAKADAEDDGDDKKIPTGLKNRLDGALNRAREAEAELRKLRAEQANEPAPEPAKGDDDGTLTIAQAQDRVAELDGEIAKALKDEEKTDQDVTALLREQRELTEGIREARSEEERAATQARTTEEIQFDRVVTELEEQIPMLNPEDKENYNEDIVQETITLAQALHGQGNRSQADSMLLAVDYMKEKLGVSGTTVADVKKTTDVEKNVGIAKKLPPDLPGTPGSSSDKGGLTGELSDAARMTDPEFEALTADEQKLRQLRGDFG